MSCITLCKLCYSKAEEEQRVGGKLTHVSHGYCLECGELHKDLIVVKVFYTNPLQRRPKQDDPS